MARNMNDRGAMKALVAYHEDLSARLGADSLLINDNPDIQRVIAGIHGFSRHNSPLQNLDKIIENAERFIGQRLVGHGDVQVEQVNYVRRYAKWLIEYKDVLQTHGNDIPVLQRYVRLVNEHIDGGQSPLEAAKEHPGFAEFKRAIYSMQPEVAFVAGTLNPPARSRNPEDDSDELVWLHDYYGELLEVRDVFRSAKVMVLHFMGWALRTIRLPGLDP